MLFLSRGTKMGEIVSIFPESVLETRHGQKTARHLLNVFHRRKNVIRLL